jgi:protein SCO1/2
MYPVPDSATETHVTKRQRNYLLHLDVCIKVRTVRNKKHKRLGVLLSVSVLLAACGQSSTNNRELFGYIPPVTKDVSQAFITDAATNTPFNFVAAPNELLIVYFGYTHCPDLCPTTLVTIKNAKKKMGELANRVDLAMITVDPDRDTKDVLPRYLASLSDRFHALIPLTTSELRDAEELFQTSSSVTVIGDKVEVVHSGTAYVIDDAGVVLVEWPFGIDAESMAHDLTVLINKKESTI